MITEGYFNHICGVYPQIHRIYRFFSHTTNEILCNVTTVS